MTNTIEQRLVDGLPAVADAILTSGGADRADPVPPHKGAHQGAHQGGRRLLVVALALAVAGLGVTVLAVRDRSDVDVATAAASPVGDDRIRDEEPELYFVASDLMTPAIPMQGRVELFERDDATELRRGDLALVDPANGDGTPLVRRLIGFPGETIVLDESLVVVDGMAIAEPYLSPHTTNPGTTAGTITLGQDEYLLLADNRGRSEIIIVPIERIGRWAPAGTTAQQPFPAAERPAEVADYLQCLKSAEVDVEGLTTDPASIFDATVSRLDPETVGDGAACMRRHHRLSLE